MVSVLEGQLTRTWFYKCNTRNHVINIYHDTITGVRSAMLDFQEIKGSIGSSSLLMESKGHRIFFTVEDLPGYLEIKRSGWAGFSYACVINDQPVPEATAEVAEDQGEVFIPKIIETTFTQDELSEHSVAWYVLRTTRVKDNVTTIVHRRFKDFVELNSQVKQNLKGNHLRWALPPIPEKPLKSMTDHRDPQFIQDRAAKLEIYISALVAVPHVSDMICVKAFVGIMEQVREFSLSFHVPTIGMSLLPSDRLGDNTPAIVGLIQKPDICSGVLPGDSISKINGVPVAGSNFNGVVTRIKALPRPLIIHFIQVIASHGTSSANSPSGKGASSSNSPVNAKGTGRGGGSPSTVFNANKPLPTFDGDVYEDKPNSNAGKTWTTYDEPDSPVASPPVSAANKQQQHRNAAHYDDEDDANVLVEDLQAVKVSSNQQSPNNSSVNKNVNNNSSSNNRAQSPVRVASPQPEPIKPSVALSTPLPLGWD